MVMVELDQVSKRYPGSPSPAVSDFSLHVADGEFVVLIGPSGCGKSTVLRGIAGLEGFTTGKVRFGTEDVTSVAARRRDIAMVFQNYALYPHLSVRANLEYPLRIASVPKSERRQIVDGALDVLGLADFALRKPGELSGGQRQRVAMGRAIVRRPRVFLMDEPLSNLDAQLRASTRASIVQLQRRLGVTTFYVTHDQVEAMTMADKVVLMQHGRIEQVGTPQEIYGSPASTFVGLFTGSPPMNFVPGALHAESPAGTALVGFRPEAAVVAAQGVGDGRGLSIDITVDVVEDVGASVFVTGRTARGPSSTPVTIGFAGATRDIIGSTLHLWTRAEDLHFFDKAGRRI